MNNGNKQKETNRSKSDTNAEVTNKTNIKIEVETTNGEQNNSAAFICEMCCNVCEAINKRLYVYKVGVLCIHVLGAVNDDNGSMRINPGIPN